ncbi:hypothetical protein ABIA33_006142 [Streptacidiphilus sp. MAP12-16]|jgi:hypothetical protein|uniref:Rv1733c family protein n=1 Tax=Streptacidiphilus sp. MAP12-16 TaxID=3156300 RepID=UPI003516ED03
MATSAAAPQPSVPARRRRLSAALARHRNPLHRRSDSLRVWLRIVLALSLAVAAGLCTLLGMTLYRSDRAAAAVTAAQLHHVQAVALTGTTQTSTDATALLRWADPNGHPDQGTVSVPISTVQGEQLQIWIDAQGHPATAPASATEAAGNVAAFSLGILAGSVLLLTGGYSVARQQLDRRTLRAWEREWDQVEPAWTGRH